MRYPIRTETVSTSVLPTDFAHHSIATTFFHACRLNHLSIAKYQACYSTAPRVILATSGIPHMSLLSPFIVLLYLLVAPIILVFGQSASSPPNGSQLVCVPFGTCEPCPEDALKEPFCQPFGNRRLMHCTPSPSSTFSQVHGQPPNTDPHSPPSGPPATNPQTDIHIGEIPAWESCGRIVEKERGDFYEFFACNFVIAVVAIGVVLLRSKQLQAMQTRQLAARIGLTRGVPGGWVS